MPELTITEAGTVQFPMVRPRFPNAAVNPDERKRLRAALYRPLLALEADHRLHIVERIAALLLEGDDSGDE